MDTTKFKLRLEEERQKLETALLSVGRRNPENPGDWEPKFNDINAANASQDEMADKFEDMEQTLATQTAYEARLTAVNEALERIKDGAYGKCNCGKDIPLERMEADPAASCMCGEHN
ncbi:MAG: hypothetical protein AAB710_02835 [Patescibacteria group bacterium]